MAFLPWLGVTVDRSRAADKLNAPPLRPHQPRSTRQDVLIARYRLALLTTSFCCLRRGDTR
jgi:hypothetical protein